MTFVTGEVEHSYTCVFSILPICELPAQWYNPDKLRVQFEGFPKESARSEEGLRTSWGRQSITADPLRGNLYLYFPIGAEPRLFLNSLDRVPGGRSAVKISKVPGGEVEVNERSPAVVCSKQAFKQSCGPRLDHHQSKSPFELAPQKSVSRSLQTAAISSSAI